MPLRNDSSHEFLWKLQTKKNPGWIISPGFSTNAVTLIVWGKAIVVHMQPVQPALLFAHTRV
jgi:hypothetical protein